MSRTARNVALVAVPFALFALAACGDDSSSDNQGAAPAATNPAAATTAAPATTAAATTAAPSGASGDPYGGGYAVPPTSTAAEESSGEAGLQLADNDEYGKILVDADGRTLYIFLFDKDGKSACDASCASSWPPLVAEGDVTLSDGLEDEDVGSITREDGTKQVTFYGHPLYHYGADQAEGDTKGQGTNEVWYVVDAEGNPVEDE